MATQLTVIIGQYIPNVNNDAEGEIVDPYVKVKITAHQKDNQKFKTEAVRINDFSQVYLQNYERSFVSTASMFIPSVVV